MRFGRPVELRKGRRRELLNVKAVIEEPIVEDAIELGRYVFDLERFRAYQATTSAFFPVPLKPGKPS